MQPATTNFHDLPWRPRRRLPEDLRDHHGIVVQPTDDPPRDSGVVHPELMAPVPDRRHRPGVRQRELLSALQPPKQHFGFDPPNG
jgi:hypothetical protein